MAHVCLEERGIILAETIGQAVAWDSLGHIDVFGVVNTIQNGSLDFGKKVTSPASLWRRRKKMRGCEMNRLFYTWLLIWYSPLIATAFLLILLEIFK